MKEDFDAEAFRVQIQSYTEERLNHLLGQLGRNGETDSSQARREIIEAELRSRVQA